jgi:hypothetical protein
VGRFCIFRFLDGEKPVITSLAGFELSEPVVTEEAAVSRLSPPTSRLAYRYLGRPQIATGRLATNSRRRLNLA